MSSNRYIAVVILILVALLSCKTKKTTTVTQDIYYTCSMHPQIISDKPGKCPICHMDLIAVSKSKKDATDEIMLSDQQIQLGNIRVDTLKRRMFGNQAVFTAVLAIDQNRLNAVSSRVKGRIDRLYYRNVGDYIAKGAPVYEIYGEDLNNAKQEYLLTLEKRRVLGNSIVDFEDLIQSARNKLVLWGMTDGQIRQLQRTGKSSLTTTFYSPYAGYVTEVSALEGQYVMEGGTIFQLAELSNLWAEVQVYTAQLAQVNRNAAVEIRIPGMPDLLISGKLEFFNPEIKGVSRMTLLRVSVPNYSHKLRPGMPAYVFIKGRSTNSITLPLDAVIKDSRGATVWLQKDKNTFKSRMVTLGTEGEGVVEIKAGLDTNDVVVTSGAYLVNSEFVFKMGADPMEGHKH
ncbi:efflux RND transporter periplasmic adaptor subunit [Polluticoccus soli]|uniref:efflux RND transporter periplasmic adaptor subunit n=1 Tax=Polluticoccus soli TaxID=3034150 RepID=UPI0023E0F055|nr:efflux RND transporter periplasmic adaptor subunit [Flavipsychrobacter sp. JY13-12]